MPKLQKVKSLSLVDNVVSQIEKAIISGEYKPGEKLPPTRQLQEIFGASLGTIREGLARLEQKRLIKVRKGTKGGFFIQEITTEPMTDSLELLMRHLKFSPRELSEFRATVEAGLIRLVVKRATEKQVQGFLEYEKKLKACLKRGIEGWHELLETERNLRMEFLAVIDNPVYGAVLLPIHKNIFRIANSHLVGDDAMTKTAYDYWKKILSAVADRDEDRAATLTKDMILHYMDLMLDRQKKAQKKQ
jgi:DNA-binding FadR family transcriptional regulator